MWQVLGQAISDSICEKQISQNGEQDIFGVTPLTAYDADGKQGRDQDNLARYNNGDPGVALDRVHSSFRREHSTTLDTH